MNKPNYYKDFITGYKIASLWSSNDTDQTDCEFLDEKFDITDFDDDLGNRLTDSCKDFGECWIYVNDDQTLSI